MSVIMATKSHFLRISWYCPYNKKGIWTNRGYCPQPPDMRTI